MHAYTHAALVVCACLGLVGAQQPMAVGGAPSAKQPLDEKKINGYTADILRHSELVDKVVIVRCAWSADRQAAAKGEIPPANLDEYINDRVLKMKAMEGVCDVVVKPKKSALIAAGLMEASPMPEAPEVEPPPGPLVNPQIHQYLYDLCSGNGKMAWLDPFGLAQQVMKQVTHMYPTFTFCTPLHELQAQGGAQQHIPAAPAGAPVP